VQESWTLAEKGAMGAGAWLKRCSTAPWDAACLHGSTVLSDDALKQM
jgi:hypothetical protein